MPVQCIDLDTLKDDNANAQDHSSRGSYAGGTAKQYRNLGLALTCLSSGFTGLE